MDYKFNKKEGEFVKIIRTYLREGMFERNIEWVSGVNLVYSTKNTCGKTTLMRALLYSLGYPVPNTKKIKFEKCIIITELENKLGNVCIRREGNYLKVNYLSAEKIFTLPVEQNEFHQLLWGTDNQELLDNIIGACYIDQEKGWTLLNRGKVIGNIRYNIEHLVRALSERECNELLLKEKRLELELKKYRQMLNIAQYKEEINEYKDELISESYDEELQKEIELLNYELSAQNKELKRIERVIKKNESFRKYIENMKIRVRSSSGEEVPVNKDTIIDMNEYIDMLVAKRRIVASEINSIKRKIEEITLKLPQNDGQISFLEEKSQLAEFDRNIVKIDVDAVHLKRTIDRLQNELHDIKSTITETTKKDNIVVDEMCKIITRYSKELNVEVKNATTYLFTRNLKELSGAVLHKLVFIYRLAAILSIEKYMGYKLPLLIDSPSGKEVDRDNVNAMMRILSRDFSQNQIIVASIYEYDFTQVEKIIIENRLITENVEEF